MVLFQVVLRWLAAGSLEVAEGVSVVFQLNVVASCGRFHGMVFAQLRRYLLGQGRNDTLFVRGNI